MKEFGRSRGLGVLLRDLAHGSADLLRGETRLARMEFTEVATSVGQGTARVALGGVLVLLGVLALTSGLILLVGDQWLPSDQYWLAALVVMVTTGAIAAWLTRKGFARLSPTQLAPDQTVETLREDKEWLKQQLTSGATSK